MKCQSCNQPATVHLTDVIHGKKREVHLCQKCAEKQEIIKHQELNLGAILQTVLGQHLGPMTDELSRLTCPTCGIKYMEFRSGGRLGCPQDYDVFKGALLPLLQRIHRAARHMGKIPVHAVRNAERQRELMDLRQKLRKAVDAEAYEDAARLRDLIKDKESTDEPG
ncbi:MAG: UvrB/UvrC motif-containing protein [Gemmataceae bacterium]|nr:UvrB/UvrC motif-containing protein [Gemmataceae bacterium]MCI0740139.1 UvrB/UvrC motif-containing protein [Gemmataceae bacterium]